MSEVSTAAPPDDVAADPAREHSAGSRVPTWVKGVLPLGLLVVLVFAFLRVGPLGVLRAGFPPVEELTIERITLPRAGEMRVRVVNGGPEPVTIAQVVVDDATWPFTAAEGSYLPRLATRELVLLYPWVEGDPHTVRLVTSTGLTFDATLDVATLTPAPDARYLTTFALLGVYVGVVPVFLGLLWLPFLRSIRPRWVEFFLAFTVGLLVFLGVDAFEAALDGAAVVAGAFQGIGLVVLGALGTPLLIQALSARRTGRGTAAFRVSTLIAIAIGLHNLGEGLAIGAAYSSGAIALGTFLVLGFLIHNTTEGLGIVAPLADERPRLRALAALGLIAGAPTILGAWIGGFTYSPILTTLFYAIGVGAVAQVVWILGRHLARGGRGAFAGLNAAGLVLGLLTMYLTGLLVTA